MSVKNCDNLSISPWIRRFSPLLPAGSGVLDLAAGGGRHSAWFLDHGHVVTAVDRRIDVLGRLKSDLPDELRPQLSIVAADLENGSPWPLPGQTFDAVIVVNYLHRPLFADLLSSLAPRGLLLYETFAQGQEKLGKPRHPDFLLAPGELLEVVRGRLQVIAFEQGLIEGANGPAVKQRIAAIDGVAPQNLAAI